LVLYPGAIDVDTFHPTEKEKSTDVLFVGTLRRLKGPDRVLEVVQRLKKEFPGISCKIVGKGHLKDSLTQYVSTNHLEDNVEILGFVESTIPYFQDAKITMIPSRSEGLPMVMLEAMGCGAVPIVSNVGNVSDVAVHGFNAMIVEDYLDIDSYCRCAKELLAHPDKLAEMRAHAVSTVREKYSVQPQSEIIGRVLGELM
jgi:glycosyltransferase involved in cell wall biosynthesis